MSFLTPLYIAGLLAVSLPIMFHLIRRTPRGQVPFSSLMFLSPSPPRLTRRSRLNNIFLLILRGLALSLLAFAFARPFLRDATSLETFDKPSRRIAILVDTSASLRRGDLWRQATAKTDQTLATVTPADQVALLTFSDAVRTHIGFDDWNKLDPAQRTGYANGLLRDLRPTWGATELGQALIAAADLLADASESKNAGAVSARQIILVTDLEAGSRLEALQAFAWPKGVTLEVQAVKSSQPTNAGLHLAPEVEEEETATDDHRVRVRVSNDAESKREQFALHSETVAGPQSSAEPIRVFVPAGTSRVVRVARPAASAVDRLVLSGDDHDFDNILYMVPPRQEELTVAFFGADKADDSAGLRYYLQRALGESPRRKVRVETIAAEEPLQPEAVRTMRLAVVAGPLSEDRTGVLRTYVTHGGTLLVTLLDNDASTLRRLTDLPALSVEEASGKDFSLLGEISFSHPLFAPFADPRFGDFTKIHFWKHRRVTLPADAKLNVLARFDNGDPAIFERLIGSGSLIVMTSSWRPVDSQLATSSKFVPLMFALVDRGQPENQRTQFTVGDTLDGQEPTAERTDQPGIVDVAGRKVAVNLAADESRTSPLAVDELEQRGARLTSEEVRQAAAARQRQLRVAELENRQKLWQWLIVAVLGLVIVETGLAGHLTKKNRQP